MTPVASERVAVVTGASRGIGRAAALALAAAGAHIIAVARTTGGLEELDDLIGEAGGRATLVPLDLGDAAGIDRLGAAIYERWHRLDVLVANAGLLGTVTPLAHLEPKTWDEVMAINLTANWRLIRSLDPLLRHADAGRALFLTSSIAVTCRPYFGAYAAAKAGLEALVKTYAGELRQTKATANLLDPGRKRTRMRAQAYPGEDPQTIEPPEAVAADIVRMVSADHTANGVRFSYPSGETVRLID
jgi:NAD(P)-dependent dehydrogenase (short-subunit alcohol dehydrogenase family)